MGGGENAFTRWNCALILTAALSPGAAGLVACSGGGNSEPTATTAAAEPTSTPATGQPTVAATATVAAPATAAPEATATSAPPAATATQAAPEPPATASATTAPEPTATEAGPAPLTLPVTIVNFAFAPETLNAQVGQQVTVNVANNGGAPHSFTIDGLTDSGVLSSGANNSVSFTPSQAGSYTFYCVIHGASTMSGTLVVE